MSETVWSSASASIRAMSASVSSIRSMPSRRRARRSTYPLRWASASFFIAIPYSHAPAAPLSLR